MNQLLQGFSDVDATDVLTIEALTAYQADDNGLPTPEIAGFVTPVYTDDILTGYEFKPWMIFTVMLYLLILSPIVMVPAIELH